MNANSQQGRVDAFTRLRSLPNWFTKKSAADFLGVSPSVAKTMLVRWNQRGLVTPLGPRSGVFINRVLEPEITANTRAAAIQSLYPEAVVMGATVLHAHGWITQIPNRLHIAILNQKSSRQLDGVEIHERPRRWFSWVQDQLVNANDAEAGAGFREITPAAALIDLVREDALPVDWDDLDFEEEDYKSILSMAHRFHVTEKIDDDDLLMASDGMAGRSSISP